MELYNIYDVQGWHLLHILQLQPVHLMHSFYFVWRLLNNWRR